MYDPSVTFSTPMRVMVRPFRRYRELAAGNDTPSVVSGAARFLFVVAAFVAVSATGRFAPFETAMAMFSFSWLALGHLVGLAAVRRAFVPELSLRRAYGLYLESLGPWLVVFLVLTGSAIFTARPPVSFDLLLPLVAIASAWSAVIVYALFRVGYGLSRGRAVGASLTFYVVLTAIVVGYYLAAGQLWPIL